MSNLNSWEDDPSAQDENLSRRAQQQLNVNAGQGQGQQGGFRPGASSFQPGAQSFQPGQAYGGGFANQYQQQQYYQQGYYPQYGQQQQQQQGFNQYNQQGGYGGGFSQGYNQGYGMRFGAILSGLMNTKLTIPSSWRLSPVRPTARSGPAAATCADSCPFCSRTRSRSRTSCPQGSNQGGWNQGSQHWWRYFGSQA